MKTTYENETWKSGLELALMVYETARQFPEEDGGFLASSMLATAVFVSACRVPRSEAAVLSEVGIDLSRSGTDGLAALETQLMLAWNLNFITEEELMPLMEKIGGVREELGAA